MHGRITLFRDLRCDREPPGLPVYFVHAPIVNLQFASSDVNAWIGGFRRVKLWKPSKHLQPPLIVFSNRLPKNIYLPVAQIVWRKIGFCWFFLEFWHKFVQKRVSLGFLQSTSIGLRFRQKRFAQFMLIPTPSIGTTCKTIRKSG